MPLEQPPLYRSLAGVPTVGAFRRSVAAVLAGPGLQAAVPRGQAPGKKIPQRGREGWLG